MSALPPRATGLAAAFVSLVSALLPLTASAQAATVNWGTYLGGTQADRVSAVVKSDVFVYAVGTTQSTNLDEPPASQPVRQTPDIFVARFNLDNGSIAASGLTKLLFGGDGVDEPLAAVVGPGNELYIVGRTTSTLAGGITPAPRLTVKLEPSNNQGGGTRAFVAKVLASGTVDWFMFLEGSADDEATGITAFGDSLYVTGWTRSSDFMGPVTTPPGGANGFVVKIQANTANPAVGWGLQPTLIGGEQDDMFHGIAVAEGSKLYVGGTTRSDTFAYGPTKVVGSYKGGPTDAIVARLDVESGSLDWVTWVGGQGADQGKGIGIGSNTESIVVAGTTTSPNNLGNGTAMTYPDAFAAWLYPSGRLKFSEVLAGSPSASEEVLAFTTDTHGNAYIGGRTSSGSFTRLAASGFDTTIESGVELREGFVWMAPYEGGDGWVSLVGGNRADEVTSLSLRTSTELIIGMQTASDAGLPRLPVAGQTYDGTLSSALDGFVSRVDLKTVNSPGDVNGGVYVRRQLDTVRENEERTNSTASLYANWDAFTGLPGVVKFEWAIGTLENYTLAKTWTSVNLDTTAGAVDLELQPGTVYYVTVRASNTHGYTAIKRSGGILVTYPDGSVPPPPPSDAGTPDAGTPDAGTPDAGNPDPGTPDAGTDGGTPGPGDGGGGGETPDADGKSPVGFGCAAGGGALPLLVLLGLFALALLSRRLGDR